MNYYLLGGISLVALAAVAFAGFQSTRLSAAQSRLTTATATEKLADVAKERDQAWRDRTRQAVVLFKERDRALAAEQAASELKQKIARDAGTDRDGPVAPTLRDAIEALTKKERT